MVNDLNSNTDCGVNFNWPKFPLKVDYFINGLNPYEVFPGTKINMKMKIVLHMRYTLMEKFLWICVFPVLAWALVVCWPWIDKWIDSL